MSLIVYATENPLVSLVSIMTTITLIKDIYNYIISPYVIANTMTLIHRFYSDTLYISDSMKELTLPFTNNTHPFVQVIFNIVSVQITSLLYLTELALHTMFKTTIMMYDLSYYIITGAEKTYNNVQLYLSYDPSSYSLDYWTTIQKEYSFDFSQIYNALLSFLAACSIFVVYRWVAKKIFSLNLHVQAPNEEIKDNKKEEMNEKSKPRRRSPRLAMLYLTDHSFSRKS